MKLNAEIDIDASRDVVWEALADYGVRKRWQAHLESVEPVSGTPGKVGAAMRLSFANEGSTWTAIESTTEARRPEFLAFVLESNSRRSLTVHTLDRLDDRRTRWKLWTNARFTGLARLRAIFRTDAIRRRLDDDMQRFKLMVETDEAERAS